MIVFNPTTDIMCDIPTDVWPSYYPNYFSAKGWELQKIDATIDILNLLIEKHTRLKNTTTAMGYLIKKHQYGIERSKLLNQFSK